MSTESEFRIQDLFKLGMDREIPSLIQEQEGLSFDLGSSGVKKIKGAIPLGLPDWNFPRDAIPAEDESASLLHAYHFLEHLSGEDAVRLLIEAQRVLIPGGVFQFCVPYYSSGLMAQDLTHKSFWNEETFRNLFQNKYYDPVAGEHTWKLKVHTQFIIGIVERNMSLLGQLRKEP